MHSFFREPSRRLFLLKSVAPIFAVAILLNLAGAALLLWATHQADRVSIDRQQRLVELIVSQLEFQITHEQESVTVWDDAVKAVQERSAEWIDVNLGTWMYTYFDHDGAYILDPLDRLIYGLVEGKPAREHAFKDMMANVSPMVAELRARLRAGDTEGISDKVLSLGVADLTMIAGHPAVVSVKPIVSDSGEIVQVPGQENLHVAVRYLDQGFLAQIKKDYLVEGLRFSWKDDRSGHEASSALVSDHGRIIGYFIWQPYLPGTAVLMRIAPMLLAVAAAGMIALGLLLVALRRRSLTLDQSEARVRHLAHHDILTGLSNRGHFNDRLDDVLRKLRKTGDKVAILYLDLDRFKEVNDTFGHPAGDALLREFADRLRCLTREIDTVARIGGDEFTVLLRNVDSPKMVEILCRRLIESAREPFDIAGTQVFVGVSIGVALATRDDVDRVELTRRADVALYHAKASGRSEFAIYIEAMDKSINARRDLERDLRAALDTPGQLQVHYQPLFSVQADRITGVEALVRWRHPQRGWVAPEIFVTLAEESGLIDKLGDWVLRQSCRTAAGWPIENISVNVSAIELSNPNFALRVADTLLSSGLNPRRLELEVTEAALTDRSGECERNIAAIRALGVRFALDDFGTGFSSLGRLHQLDVDRVKIDRSFVNGFGQGNGDEAIMQAIVDLARATGLKTTAEGVETAPQSDYLKSIGCDVLQGFMLSRPLPAAEVEKLWSAERQRSGTIAR